MLLIAASSKNPLRCSCWSATTPPSYFRPINYDIPAHRMRKNRHTAQIATLGIQQLHAKGSQFRWRLYAYSHLTSPHHTLPRILLYISTTLHIIPPNPAELRRLGVHQDPSHSIYSHNFSNSNHKNIHLSFHIPHPTQIQLASREKKSQSKTAEPAKQTLPRSSSLSCMHNTFHPPNPSTQLPEPLPHL